MRGSKSLVNGSIIRISRMLSYIKQLQRSYKQLRIENPSINEKCNYIQNLNLATRAQCVY